MMIDTKVDVGNGFIVTVLAEPDFDGSRLLGFKNISTYDKWGDDVDLDDDQMEAIEQALYQEYLGAPTP